MKLKTFNTLSVHCGLFQEGEFCNGQEVTLTCSQEINISYDFLQWRLVNPMSVTEDTASFRTGGSVNLRTLMVVGVMFEAELTLINSSLIQSTLTVTSVPQLNGVVIQCFGAVNKVTSPITVTSE